MKAESIMSQITGLFAEKSLPKTDVQQKTGASFGDVMKKSASENGKPKEKLVVSTSKSDKFTEDVQNTVKPEQPKKVDVPEKDFATVTEGTKTKEDVLTQETVSEIDSVVRDVVKDILDITDEELDVLLAELGIPAIALLDISNLQQFVVLAGDAEDVTALLTDETLANMFTQISDALEGLELPENFQVSDESIAELIQGMEDGSGQNFAEMLAAAEQKPGAESVQDQNAQLSEQETAVEGPVITVEREENLSGQQNNSMSEDKDTDGTLSQIAGVTEEADSSHTVNPVQVFAQNLAEAGQTAQTEQSEARMVQMVDIVNQVVEQIKVVIRQDVTSMEMQLNPEHLGKVSLTVSAKEGIMTASFVVQSEAAKEALESQMQILKDQFNEKNIKVEAVEVTVSDFTFAQSDQTGTGEQQSGKNQNRTLRMVEEEDSLDEDVEEDLTAKVMADNGGSIDYTA